MIYVKAWHTAGSVSTLVFHQGVLWLLYEGGFWPRAPWNMTPVPPLHAPAVISLAFWGGLCAGHRVVGSDRWFRWQCILDQGACGIGALGPSLVAWFVVMPIKGLGAAGGWDPKIIVGALLLNGAWGVGTALLIRMLSRVSLA